MASLRNKVMVLNAGSSSLKFKLFQREGGDVLKAVASGYAERIGDPSSSTLKVKAGDSEQMDETPMKDHTTALGLATKFLANTFGSGFAAEVHSVGHRVVHGRDISKPVLITDDVRKKIQDACDLAPLHNPPNIQGIDAAFNTFASAPQAGGVRWRGRWRVVGAVAIFDTAFHQTMPPAAFMYALPYELYVERAIRRFGFHGSSYVYLLSAAAKILGKPPSETNLARPTSAASRAASAAGKADLRHSLEGWAAGDERAKLAIDVFVHRVRK
eukprot:scaffold22.g6076.t1